MNNALTVSIVKGDRQISYQTNRIVSLECRKMLQRGAFDVFHHDVGSIRLLVLAYIEDGHDGRVRKPACRLGFSPETLAILGLHLKRLAFQGDTLDRNYTVDMRVEGAVHDTHPPASDLPEDLITSESSDPMCWIAHPH